MCVLVKKFDLCLLEDRSRVILGFAKRSIIIGFVNKTSEKLDSIVSFGIHQFLECSKTKKDTNEYALCLAFQNEETGMLDEIKLFNYITKKEKDSFHENDIF